jgi:hypothetical protein
MLELQASINRPQKLTPLVHSPMTRPPLQSSFVSSPGRHLSALGHYRHSGYVPINDITRHRPLAAGGSSAPLRLRSQAFSTSQRFPPATSFAGLFHPTAESRVRLRPRDSHSLQQSQLIARTRAPLPFDLWSLTGKPAATSTGLDFEAFLHKEPRCLQVGVNLPETRSLLRVCVSSRRSPSSSLP